MGSLLRKKIKLDCACPGSVDYNDYAVIGRQAPFGNQLEVGTDNLCEPLATIGKSQNQSNVPTATIVDATLAKNRIPTKVEDALDIEGQIARAIYTSKPFAQLQYTWRDCDYNPYLGVHGGAEIPHGKTKNAAARLWHVGVEGGIAF